MKTVLAALLIAVAVPAATVPAAAASLTLSQDGDVVLRRDHRHHEDRGAWRHRDRERDWRRHHRRDCRTKVVRSWRHHREVVREVTVCG